EARMRRDVTFLASDKCEGRGVDTQGIHLAADYIAGEFQKAGLKPGGPKASYFQPFSIAGGTAKLEEPATLRLVGPQGQRVELKAGEHFDVLGLSGSGKLDAPVVFAGYGITAPAVGYEDYKGLDVAGKVVLILRKTPRWENEHAPFDGDRQQEH